MQIVTDLTWERLALGGPSFCGVHNIGVTFTRTDTPSTSFMPQ